MHDYARQVASDIEARDDEAKVAVERWQGIDVEKSSRCHDAIAQLAFEGELSLHKMTKALELGPQGREAALGYVRALERAGYVRVKQRCLSNGEMNFTVLPIDRICRIAS